MNCIDVLRFPVNSYIDETVEYNGKTLIRRCYKNQQYVRQPVNAAYQSLDVYVPLSYGEKKFCPDKAPVLLLNRCAGYMSYSPVLPRRRPPTHMHRRDTSNAPKIGPAPGAEGRGMNAPGDTLNAALASGLVVVIPGNRGRDCVSPDGVYFGKAPSMIVDLKAAVRYLRHNAGRIPGDMEHIISRGASAGGGMSTLLSCSGNDPDYEPYLRAIGAAEERDDVFAGVAMSPVMDLEHQDCAYEWQYGKLPLNGFDNVIKPPVDQKMSAELAAIYEEYLPTLDLMCRKDYGKLTPRNYKEYYLNEFLLPAADKWLRAQSDETLELYSSDRPWLHWDGRNASFSFSDYEIYLGRLKGMPAFDSIELGQSENTAFGRDTEPAAHYTEYVIRRITGDNTVCVPEHIMEQRNLLNPMVRLKKGTGQIAEHWWFRLGTKESGFACPLVVNAATAMENRFEDVNFRLIWDGGHCAEDDLDEQMKWISDITGYIA